MYVAVPTHQCDHSTTSSNSASLSTSTIQRNAHVLLNACKDIGLAVNTGKTKYMEIGHRVVIANEHG